MTKTTVAKMFNMPVEDLNKQYRANALQLQILATKAALTGRKERGKTADGWQKLADHFKFLADPTIKPGMPVAYVVDGKEWFRGEVLDINTDPKDKPYVLKVGAEIKFSNIQFLKAI